GPRGSLDPPARAPRCPAQTGPPLTRSQETPSSRPLYRGAARVSWTCRDLPCLAHPWLEIEARPRALRLLAPLGDDALVLAERELHGGLLARRRHQLELELVDLQVLAVAERGRRAVHRDLQHAVDRVDEPVELGGIEELDGVVPGLGDLVVADDLPLQLDLDVDQVAAQLGAQVGP